ncbi:hypothetical protein CGRA01v4_06797 [Colletotrichum graminicola]|nr:hypothetical protein CGRA01v4_06797 [Colletotrichum graminicola]
MIHDEKRRPAAGVRQYRSADQGGLSWVRMQLASSPDAMTMLNRETEAPPNHRRHLLQASRPQLDMSDKGAIFGSPLKSACANDGDTQYSLAFLLGHDTFLSLPCFNTFSKLLSLREDHISLRFYAQHEDVIQQAHDVEMGHAILSGITRLRRHFNTAYAPRMQSCLVRVWGSVSRGGRQLEVGLPNAYKHTKFRCSPTSSLCLL